MYTVWRETLAGGNTGEFGESSMIRRTKPLKLVLIINNLLVDLLICQTFFHQMLKTNQFINVPPTKVSLHTVSTIQLGTCLPVIRYVYVFIVI